MENIEIWKSIQGFEDIYEISNLGMVIRKSILTKNGNNYHFCKEKELISTFYNNGYFRIGLTKNSKQVKFYIHRLVAIAFIPNPKNKPQVNHKDGDKTNNNDWNLEWSTISENSIHAFNLGLRTSLKGSSHLRSKLTEKDVYRIRELKSKMTNTAIKKLYEVSQSCISNIINKKTWKHI
jgi:hypothetical protein